MTKAEKRRVTHEEFISSIYINSDRISSLSNVSAATYEFYHVAVRDYDGDAVFNNGDVTRYGFTYKKTGPQTLIRTLQDGMQKHTIQMEMK